MACMTMCSARRLAISALTWRSLLLFLLQVLLVAGVELVDDGLHAFVAQNNVQLAQANALRVVAFEAAHGFWIEPEIQGFFQQTHSVLGLTISWPDAAAVANTLYGPAHVLVTLLFAFWIFCSRRALFAFLRDVFLITNAVAVAVYELFPLAPPRLAAGLRFDGRPVHFVDTVFGAGQGIKLSFNEFAAMPSLHVGWALIVGLTLAWVAQPRVLRLVGLAYPLVMLVAVVVSGNHYIADALGATAIVACAIPLAVLIEWRRHRDPSLLRVLQRLHALRRPHLIRRPWEEPEILQATPGRRAA